MKLHRLLPILPALALILPLALCEVEEEQDPRDDENYDPDEEGTCFFKCEPTDGFFYYGCYYNTDDVTVCATEAKRRCEHYSDAVDAYLLVRGCMDCDQDCAPSWYPDE